MCVRGGDRKPAEAKQPELGQVRGKAVVTRTGRSRGGVKPEGVGGETGGKATPINSGARQGQRRPKPSTVS